MAIDMGGSGLNGPSIRRAPDGAEAGPQGLSTTFRRETLRIAEARRVAAEYLAASQRGRDHALPERTADAVQLVVSELITNAVKYGRGLIELTLARTDDTLTVTVRDGGTTLPVTRPADPGRVGQHGLEIVAALSQAVEIRREASGKRVTALIALR
uniref:Putative anti-sigma factor, regulator of HasL and HasR n=2 Tax=Streptomyces ambofaciens (strain ATCC 23877 / 3486 / DSM 40053 / JCM 4204 / NBRC 12836 / NRRL B-2516) TaxID=278992 RepID=A3KIB6_STRA7|nr:putative anti-sigma factor, regulator of HasL and HasR [Streptomyces ambofaciens ATCC 23877]